MNADNLITAIEKFFFEIIGQLIPGLLLVCGLYIVLPNEITSIFKPANQFGYWILVATSYAVGGALTAFGDYFFIPSYVKIINSTLFSRILPKNAKEILVTDEDLDNLIAGKSIFKKAKEKFPGIDDFKTIRNIAMSLISSADKETTVRFRFLSLLSQGIATTIFILSVALVFQISVTMEAPLEKALYILGVTIALIVIDLPFVLRGREFCERSKGLPIYAVMAKLSAVKQEVSSDKDKKVVYLAGGHRTQWQERVISEVNGFDYKDPSKHGLEDSKLYTEWDLAAIRQSDIVFAYFEASNPSGYGLTLEVGYASALGKFVIFIDEKSSCNTEIERYLRIVREASNVVFESLDEGIAYLKKHG